jgi:predicted ATP-dependent Lon-type protease
VGPFGDTLTGESLAVVQAIATVLSDAFEAGATRVTVQVSTVR